LPRYPLFKPIGEENSDPNGIRTGVWPLRAIKFFLDSVTENHDFTWPKLTRSLWIKEVSGFSSGPSKGERPPYLF